MVELARRRGGDATRILEQTPVRRIDLDGDRPVVVTDTARITADRLIVSAGAWVKRLLPGLDVPLRVTRQQVLYVLPDDLTPFRIGPFPVFIFKGASDLDAFYGMPMFLNLGVKVARHGGPEVDPEKVDRTTSAEAVSSVRHFLRGHIPALDDAPISHTEVCLYTVAPEEQFPGRLPAGTQRRARRQPVQRPWVQVLVPDRTCAG